MDGAERHGKVIGKRGNLLKIKDSETGSRYTTLPKEVEYTKNKREVVWR